MRMCPSEIVAVEYIGERAKNVFYEIEGEREKRIVRLCERDRGIDSER